MPRIIWNRQENPSEYVSDRHGITREQIGDAIHELRPRVILAVRTVLSYMMTVRSRMSAAMCSATSTTKSESRSRAFATLRFAGDALTRTKFLVS